MGEDHVHDMRSTLDCRAGQRREQQLSVLAQLTGEIAFFTQKVDDLGRTARRFSTGQNGTWHQLADDKSGGAIPKNADHPFESIELCSFDVYLDPIYSGDASLGDVVIERNNRH